MTQTIAQLGARALRKIGILVPLAPPAEEGTVSSVSDVAVAALRKLGVIIPEELPSALDLAEALRRAQSVHQLLESLGYTSWTNTSIPDSVVEFYIVMTANLVAPQFGKPAMQDAFNSAQVSVREMALAGAYGQSLAADKIRAVHYALEAVGKTRWTVMDIPDFAEEPYVMMAAVLLAPECGRKGDPTWSQVAEAQISRVISLQSAREPVQTDYF